MKNENEEKIGSFVPFPRQLKRDLLNGKFTISEFRVYTYIRLSGNPYGIAVVNLGSIKDDVFSGGVSHNYCNKILLSLRRKRYVYYPDRSGRRGSFEVHLGDWILKDRKIKTLDHFFESEPVRGGGSEKSILRSGPNPSTDADNQRFSAEGKRTFPYLIGPSDNPVIRGSYTDTNKETDKYDRRIKTPNEEQLIPVKGFEPVNHEQWRCHEIAREIGFEGMGQILHYLKMYDLSFVENSYSSYKEALQSTDIANKEAYFVGVLRRKAKTMYEVRN